MARKKRLTLGDLADLLDAELDGDATCTISGLGTLANAVPGQLSFLSNPSYVDKLAQTRASAVLLTAENANSCPTNKLICADPYVSFARASAVFARAISVEPGIHPAAVVAEPGALPASVAIGANAVIEAGVSLGEDCVIGPNCIVSADAVLGHGCVLHRAVVVYPEVVIGNNVTIHAGTVIGADGFGYAFDGNRAVKIHQLGSVRIGNDVEIGAGTTIDRGAIDDTMIGDGVKIDNQVQVGHNCIIGDHTRICGCVAIAGSAIIGKHCVLGGASGMIGHISIADGVQVSAMSLVSQSIREAGAYSSGTGQMEIGKWKRAIVRFQQLDNMAARLKALEKK
ncbi:MAG: UDP-3-O-(3-hydroxymyristoyl)glucosamine N-acyltransferase [Gammaproteobacteria bacterium]